MKSHRRYSSVSESTEIIRPFIRIYTKYRRIVINLNVHDLLGKPPYFEFYWNEEKSLLFIASLWEPKKGSFQIPLRFYQSRRNEIALHEELFFNYLMNKLSWQNDAIYKVFGDFLPKYNMVGFHMADPISMERAKR